jgi:hypothetical protein
MMTHDRKKNTMSCHELECLPMMTHDVKKKNTMPCIVVRCFAAVAVGVQTLVQKTPAG